MSKLIVELIHRLSKLMLLVAATTFFVLMIVTVADVGIRYLRGSGIAGSLEVVTMAMVGAAYLAMPAGEEARVHVRTPILVSRLPARARALCRLIGLLAVVTLLGTMTKAASTRALSSYEGQEKTMGLHALLVWPARAAIVVAFVALTLEFLTQIPALVREILAREGDDLTDGAEEATADEDAGEVIASEKGIL